MRAFGSPLGAIYMIIMLIGIPTIAHDVDSVIPINVINYYCPTLIMRSNDTLSSLYDTILAKASCFTSSTMISIVFQGRIILNLVNDLRTIKDIGIDTESNDIQIIKKPRCAALLEMISDIRNIENVPWLNDALCCISEHSKTRYCSISRIGKGLGCDDSGHLIAIDLSHLNLTGTIHLEPLPQSVRSLDISFNDLESFDLDGLRGKSVEKLNVEQNGKCHINTECFYPESVHNLPFKELQISSNQIFPEIRNLKERNLRIRKWLNCRQTPERLVVDGVAMYRGTIISPLTIGMLRVIEGVTNKQVIPWFQPFTDDVFIPTDEWSEYWVEFKRRRDGYPSRYKFDVSGLGLEGHIDLGALPRNVVKLDLSKNNLSSISFDGDPQHCLEELNVRNNDNLHINLLDIERSSVFCSFARLVISPNQLIIDGVTTKTGKMEYVREWLMRRTSRINRVVMDHVTIDNMAKPQGDPILYQCGMLHVVEGVINKDKIPWHNYFSKRIPIPAQKLESLGIMYNGLVPGNKFKRSRARCHFNLRGLGLEGHINLGYLPKNIVQLDLSNNNLSSISFTGNAQYNLRELNLQNNEHLRIELTNRYQLPPSCCLDRLHILRVSANQLPIRGDLKGRSKEHVGRSVQTWLSASGLTQLQVIVD